MPYRPHVRMAAYSPPSVRCLREGGAEDRKFYHRQPLRQYAPKFTSGFIITRTNYCNVNMRTSGLPPRQTAPVVDLIGHYALNTCSTASYDTGMNIQHARTQPYRAPRGGHDLPPYRIRSRMVDTDDSVLTSAKNSR